MTRAALVHLVAGALALLAAGVWLGGIVVLGAIVAPIVFHQVPAPASADAMTNVFVTFDKLAMTAAAIVAVAEVVRIRSREKTTPVSMIDALRLGVIIVAGALAVIQGVWLSPTIVALHRDGAIRGLGPLGERLERFHAWSEMCGKTESLLLVGLIVLLAQSLISAGAEFFIEPTNASARE